MGLRTDELNTVDDPVIPEVGVHVSAFHPFGYDAKLKLRLIGHLNSHDRQDIGMLDPFGNQHLLTEPLKIT